MADLTITPDRYQFPALISKVEDGTLKLPAFQREFVWPIEKTIDLLDSIARRYPIGTFLLWQTNEKLRSVKEIGGLGLPETPAGENTRYILDGQQRITSLYAATHQVEIEGRKYNLCVDLDDRPETEAEYIFRDMEPDGERFVLVSDLLGDDYGRLSDSLTPERRSRLYTLRERIREYPFSFTLIEGGDLDAVCDIFERVNNSGVDLSVFDLLVAKTWSEDTGAPGGGFNLRDEFEGLKEELDAIEYDDLAEAEITRLAGALIRDGDCSRKAILDISREEMRSQWPTIRGGISSAVDFIRAGLSVPTSRLLPYSALVVPIAYFFAKGNKPPNQKQTNWLRRYFFLGGLAARFQYAVPGALSYDISNLIDPLLRGEFPDIPHNTPDLSPETIGKTPLSLGSAYCRSLLCLLAAKRPLDFRNGYEVHLQRKFLNNANSKQYHHIFPKAYLHRTLHHEGNIVANIAFVSADSNRRIGAQPPSRYLTEYSAENPGWNRILATHAVSQAGWQALQADDWTAFVDERARALSELAQEAIAEA